MQKHEAGTLTRRRLLHQGARLAYVTPAVLAAMQVRPAFAGPSFEHGGDRPDDTGHGGPGKGGGSGGGNGGGPGPGGHGGGDAGGGQGPSTGGNPGAGGNGGGKGGGQPGGGSGSPPDGNSGAGGGGSGPGGSGTSGPPSPPGNQGPGGTKPGTGDSVPLGGDWGNGGPGNGGTDGMSPPPGNTVSMVTSPSPSGGKGTPGSGSGSAGPSASGAGGTAGNGPSSAGGTTEVRGLLPTGPQPVGGVQGADSASKPPAGGAGAPRAVLPAALPRTGAGPAGAAPHVPWAQAGLALALLLPGAGRALATAARLKRLRAAAWRLIGEDTASRSDRGGPPGPPKP